jgi:hypothetical protein
MSTCSSVSRDLAGRKRFLLSLYVPLIMRMLGQAAFCAPQSRQFLRDMFADVRMLCYDTGLMNRVAKLMWRICASLRSAERLVDDLLLFDSVHLR